VRRLAAAFFGESGLAIFVGAQASLHAQSAGKPAHSKDLSQRVVHFWCDVQAAPWLRILSILFGRARQPANSEPRHVAAGELP